VSFANHWASPTSASIRWLVGVAPWILATAVGLVWLTGHDRDDQLRLLNDAPFATAAVVSVDGRQVDIAYTHSVVGRVVADLDGADVEEGARIEIAYDADDPYRVMPTDEGAQPDLTPWIVAGAVALAVATFILMHWSARRARSLAADDSTAFAMLASIHHSRLSVVPRLSLYPVDSRPGDRPVCTVRLADIRVDVPSERCFEVEVKGIPRPGGRVVVRRGGSILWPRGRALLTARYQRPSLARPQKTSGRPSGELPPPAWPPSQVDLPVGGVPEQRDPKVVGRFLLWLAVIGGVGVVITSVVALITFHKADAIDRWSASGSPAVATIVSHNDLSVNVDVVLETAADAPPRAMLAPVDYPQDYDPGRKYPAVVSPDGQQVRLRAEPYDPVEPVLWWGIPTAIALWWSIRRWIGA
jgi:hypothetical protein